MVHKPKNPKYLIVSDHFPIMGVFKPLADKKENYWFDVWPLVYLSDKNAVCDI